MRELGYDEALALLEKAVEDKGADHTAPVCEIYDAIVRSETGVKEPVCIVGYAIHELVGTEAFQAVQDGGVDIPLESVGYYVTGKTKNLLMLVQRYQDGFDIPGVPPAYTEDTKRNPRPWGNAVKFAKENAVNG